MHEDIVKMNERYQQESEILQKVRAEVGKVIIGQQELVEALLLALLCNGHVLIEGIPGLAKSRRSRKPCTPGSTASSSPPTCCPAT